MTFSAARAEMPEEIRPHKHLTFKSPEDARCAPALGGGESIGGWWAHLSPLPPPAPWVWAGRAGGLRRWWWRGWGVRGGGCRQRAGLLYLLTYSIKHRRGVELWVDPHAPQERTEDWLSTITGDADDKMVSS